MEYRIEAVHPAIVDSVRRFGRHKGNGVLFTIVDGRVLSEPVGPQTVETQFHGRSGYILCRAEAPYERVNDLAPGATHIAAPTPEQAPTEPPARDDEPPAGEAPAGDAPPADDSASTEPPAGDDEPPAGNDPAGGALDYATLTKAQLQALLEQRGLAYNRRAPNTDLIAALEAADAAGE